MANRSKRLSERSSRSTDNRRSGNRDLEYFWSVVLSSEKRSVKWVINESGDDDDDEEYNTEMKHTLFLKLAVLGGNAVSGEQNIVMLQSTGDDGKPQKGAIAHLTRGLNPMTQLDLTITGKNGCTFTLSEGSGPVTIAANHMIGYPSDDDDDDTDDTQMDELTAEEENIEKDLNESDDESEEEIKDKKSAKRKATPKAIKHKQKAKMDVDDHSGEGEEDDDDDDEDEDYDFEKEVKNKKFKKAKVAGKKNEKSTKTKPEKDSGKKSGKNVKK